MTRIAIPKYLRELEDTELFFGCDLLAEISFGGSAEMFDNLTRGGVIAVQKSDLTTFIPKINCLDLKDEI